MLPQVIDQKNQTLSDFYTKSQKHTQDLQKIRKNQKILQERANAGIG